MPQPGKATPDAVRSAIAALESRGEAVTLQAVRAAIGGGSLATIHPLVRAWRQQRDSAAQPPAETAAEGSPDAVVPARVTQTLAATRTALEAISGSVAEALAAAVADEQRRSRLELAAERQAADQRQAAAVERVRQAEAETDQLARVAAEVEAERDQVTERLAEVMAERDRLTARLAEVETALTAALAERDRLAVRATAQERRVAELEADLGPAREAVVAERQRVEALHAGSASAQAAQARAEAERDTAREHLAELRAIVDRLAPPATAKPEQHSAEPPQSPPSSPPRPRRSRKAP